LVVAIVLAATSAAQAQVILAPNFYENQGQAYARRDSPALRRERLVQAIALREEASRLQAADGGTLSPADLAYVRGRAAAIEGLTLAPATGSLITRR
jgi:hypothetical protein